MIDPLDQRKRRLHFRAWHRGTREADLLIGGFVDSRLNSFGEADLHWMERLLDEQDVDILAWIMGTAPPPEAFAGPLMDAMRQLDYVPPPGDPR